MRTVDAQAKPIAKGRQIESITVGEMPGQQIIIYDKRREAISKNLAHWFEVWDIDPKDRDRKVLRVEIRAGKKHLKERWRLSTFGEIESCIGDVLKLSVEEIRYLARMQSDQTVTRRRLHPVWKKVSEIVLYATAMHQSGLLPGQVIEIERRVIVQRNLAAVFSSAISLTVALGVRENETIEDLVPRVAADNIRALIEDNPEQFARAVERAQARYHFI